MMCVLNIFWPHYACINIMDMIFAVYISIIFINI